MRARRAWLVALIVMGGAVCAAPKPEVKRGSDMTCTRTMTPAEAGTINKVLGDLPAGAVLCLKPGEYRMRLWVERSLTVKADGGPVVIDGHGEAPVIQVVRKDVDFVLEGVTLRRGTGGGDGKGGNLHVDKCKSVVARDVVFEDGSSDDNGGGAVLVNRGEVVLERCTLRKNRGKKAHAALAYPGSKLTLRDCFVVENGGGKSPEAAAIVLSGPAELVMERSTVSAHPGPAVVLRGDENARLTITSSILKSPIVVIKPNAEIGGRIAIASSALLEAPPSGTDRGGNLVGDIPLDAGFRPKAGSPAAAMGPQKR